MQSMEECYSKYVDTTNPNTEPIYLRFHTDLISNPKRLTNDFIQFGYVLNLPFLFEGGKPQKLLYTLWDNIYSEIKYDAEAPALEMRPDPIQRGAIAFGAHNIRRKKICTFLNLPNLARNTGMLEEYLHSALEQKSGDAQKIIELYEKSGYKDFEGILVDISTEIGEKRMLEKGFTEVSERETLTFKKEIKKHSINAIEKRYGMKRKDTKKLVIAFNNGRIDLLLARNIKMLKKLKIDLTMFRELNKLQNKTEEVEKWVEGIAAWHYDRITRSLGENPEYNLFQSYDMLSNIAPPTSIRGQGVISISKLEEKLGGETSFSKYLDSLERKPLNEQIQVLNSLLGR